MIPHLRFYTNNLPDGVAGRANAFVVRIRPAYKDDVGLLMHELEHVFQWYTSLMLHPLLYRFIRRYRLWSEVSAYREQMCFPDKNDKFLSLAGAAERLAMPRYKLGLTRKQAKEKLID